MVTLAKSLLFATLATSLMLPAAAIAKPQPDAKPAVTTKRTKVTVRPAYKKPATKKRWNGYGFLPAAAGPDRLAGAESHQRVARASRTALLGHLSVFRIRATSLRLGPSGHLSRPMERRQLRSVLDADADRDDQQLLKAALRQAVPRLTLHS
jgi:hypothetical protein